MARAFDACLFDMDGVLVDSMPQHHRAYATVLAPYGVDVPREAVYAREGMNARHVVRELLAPHGIALTDAEAERLGEAKQAAFRGFGVPPLAPGAAGAVQRLKATGLRLAVVTGGTRENAAHNLGSLATRFEAIVADGDYARQKPDPEPYLVAAWRLGVPPQRCVVVENAVLGVRAAVAAGMYCVALPTTMPSAALRRAGAHVLAASLTEAAERILAGPGGEGFKRG